MGLKIVVAGMPRAGSTWLYNVLRYCYINAGYRTYADNIDRYDPAVRAAVHVVKIHTFDAPLLAGSHYVFTTCRDIRDAVASLVRRRLVPNEPDALARTTSSILEDEYAPWAPYSDLEVRYESMISDKPKAIRDILDVLGLGGVDPAVVHQDVEKTRHMAFAERDRTTQLWPDHFTDGRVNSFWKTLAEDSVRAVEEVGKAWLEARGYPAVAMRPPFGGEQLPWIR